MTANYSVLFVCLGNICRSPLAEAAFRQEIECLGLEVEVDSAGIGVKRDDMREAMVGRLRP